MAALTKSGAMIMIKALQNSDARNYFETGERLSLHSILADLEKNGRSDDYTLNEKQSDFIERLYHKYRKFI